MAITVTETRIVVTPTGIARVAAAGTLAQFAVPTLINVAAMVATKITGGAIAHVLVYAVTDRRRRG